jgi:hypothetical protein
VKHIKQILNLTEVLIVTSSLLLFVATTSSALTRSKSYGEWTATCSYGDMLEVMGCSVMSDYKTTRQGLIRGKLYISGSPPMLTVIVSGATPARSGPILKVDDNPPMSGIVQFAGPNSDVKASSSYSYLIAGPFEAQAAAGKRLRVRVPLDTGNLEAVFDLSGYSRAKALVDHWQAGK